jgi:hypothetical protein
VEAIVFLYVDVFAIHAGDTRCTLDALRPILIMLTERATRSAGTTVCFLFVVLTDPRTFAVYTRVGQFAVLASVTAIAVYTILSDLVVLTTTTDLLTVLAYSLPLTRVFLAKRSCITVFTGVVVAFGMVRALFLTTGLTVVLDVPVFTFDIRVAVRTL